jgi:hypothetical protein
MIDTDDYEGHTPAPWEITEYIDHIVVSETKSNEVNGVDAALIAAAPDLLKEVKRLRKLEAAVVGSWKYACSIGAPWGKELRSPCHELGYLQLENQHFDLTDDYESMAEAWVKEYWGEEE